MDANANPSFEVATIKPSKTDQPGRFFRFRGRHFTTTNTSLNDLISYSYKIHDNQIIGAPGWAGTEKYDIDAKPDGEGMPSDQAMERHDAEAAGRALHAHLSSRQEGAFGLCALGRQERPET